MLSLIQPNSESHAILKGALVRVKCGCCSQVAWRHPLTSSYSYKRGGGTTDTRHGI